MILQRIEITLVGPDEWPQEETELEAWLREERLTRHSVSYQLRDAIRSIMRGLPEQFELEVTNL